MSTDVAPRSSPDTHRTMGTLVTVLAAGALLLGACGDDDTADAGAPTQQADASPTTADAPDDEASTSETLVGPERIVGEFHAVEAGRWMIDTLGIPLVLELAGEWWVQPNHAGFTVLTHPDSAGPQDRDIVFIRPSGLVEPGRVNDSPEGFRSQRGWPLSDIDGWLDRVLPGLVDGDPVDTTLGGRAAVRFDVAPSEDFPCGPEACAGFVTNEWIDSTHFEPGKRRTVWWVDGGVHGPLAVLVGRDAGDTDWLDTAEAVLDTVELGEPGPHPVGDEDPVSLGLPGEVTAGEIVVTPHLGGLRFVIPEDRFIHQAPGFVAIMQPELPVEIDMVQVVETRDGTPIDTVDAAVARIAESTTTLEEIGTATIAGADGRIFDMTAEATTAPGPEQAAFRTSEGCDCGWIPPAEGRLWLLDTPRGILLLTAEVLEPGAADIADVIAEAETVHATLELVEDGS